MHNQPVEWSKLTETWEEMFPKIRKNFLNSPVLSCEPSIRFVLWLSFLPLIGRLNHLLDEALTRDGNLFLRVRNNLFLVQKYIANQEVFPMRRGREDFLGIRLKNEKDRGIPTLVSGSVVKVLNWQAADLGFSPLFSSQGYVTPNHFSFRRIPWLQSEKIWTVVYLNSFDDGLSFC